MTGTDILRISKQKMLLLLIEYETLEFNLNGFIEYTEHL